MIQNNNRPGAVVSLGMFDGVHMGHRALLNAAMQTAKENDFESVVYTFENHPMSVLGKKPKLLMTFQERCTSIKESGIDRVDAVHFDMQLASMEPIDFVKMLLARCSIRCIIAGFNYSFGKFGMGNSENLVKFGKELNFDVRIIPPVIFNGSFVSSTRIRECLENGSIEEANEMLVSRYTLSGKVVSNRRIGTKIGFPTANIIVSEEKLLPLNGVYASVAKLNNGNRYYAVTNIGKNPTVQGSRTTIESHLIDFTDYIYGTQMSVMLLKRIRDEIKFPGLEALSCQIGQDKRAVQEYFKYRDPGL